MTVLVGPVITVMFRGAGRRNNSIWKLSILLSLFMWKIWYGQISAVFQVFFCIQRCDHMFFYSSLGGIIKNICGVKKKAKLFIHQKKRKTCLWLKNVNEHSSDNCLCQYLHYCAVEVSSNDITRIIRKMFSIPYQTPSIVNFNLAQNYFEFQKKGSTLTLTFLGKMETKFVFSTSFRQCLQQICFMKWLAIAWNKKLSPFTPLK